MSHLRKDAKQRSTSTEEDYLINGSQITNTKEQSEYYIQYYLEN